jgi:hypothetical protein
MPTHFLSVICHGRASGQARSAYKCGDPVKEAQEDRNMTSIQKASGPTVWLSLGGQQMEPMTGIGITWNCRGCFPTRSGPYQSVSPKAKTSVAAFSPFD